MAKKPRPKSTRNRTTGWKGESKKTNSVTIRLPPEVRQAIEGDRTGRKLSPFIRELIRLGFAEKERAGAEDPVRGLCALIERLSGLVCNKIDEKTGKPEFNWLTHPFMYRTFQFAIQKLMDARAPLGEVVAPKVNFEKDETQWPRVVEMSRGPYDTPENRAEWAVEKLLAALMVAEPAIDAKKLFGSDMPPDMASEIERDNRRLFLARQALTPKG